MQCAAIPEDMYTDTTSGKKGQDMTRQEQKKACHVEKAGSKSGPAEKRGEKGGKANKSK